MRNKKVSTGEWAWEGLYKLPLLCETQRGRVLLWAKMPFRLNFQPNQVPVWHIPWVPGLVLVAQEGAGRRPWMGGDCGNTVWVLLQTCSGWKHAQNLGQGTPLAFYWGWSWRRPKSNDRTIAWKKAIGLSPFSESTSLRWHMWARTSHLPTTAKCGLSLEPSI